jgi:hypothetical protein
MLGALCKKSGQLVPVGRTVFQIEKFIPAKIANKFMRTRRVCLIYVLFIAEYISLQLCDPCLSPRFPPVTRL